MGYYKELGSPGTLTFNEVTSLLYYDLYFKDIKEKSVQSRSFTALSEYLFLLEFPCQTEQSA